MEGSSQTGRNEITLDSFKALSADERLILAGFAVVGEATLSADQLRDLVETKDAEPIVAALERRGLIRRRGNGRFAALARLEERIGKTRPSRRGAS